MNFLQKRWVRAIGLVPMTLYTFFSLALIHMLVGDTVLRPVNQVFAMTDGVGWLGFLFYLGFIGATGIMAGATAHYMRGVFKILYVAGAFAILYAVAFLPLSFVFNAEVDFRPDVPNSQFVEGRWKDVHVDLTLLPDSTYRLTYDHEHLDEETALGYEGRWSLERNKVHLSSVHPRWPSPWEVRASGGYHFITYSVPDNPDAWSGNLGLMRERDWLANQ